MFDHDSSDAYADQMTSHVVIAIDGPAGSGKSSVSRAVASALGLRYLDTGAMYRGVTWAVCQAGIDPDDPQQVEEWVAGSNRPEIVSGTDPVHPTISVAGIDVSSPIREGEVTRNVSAVSAVPAVRTWLVGLQRQLASASNSGIVVEGRDVGTVVFPEAAVKIFLTADASVRATRRAAETSQSGEVSNIQDVASSLAVRDEKDSTRATSPLVRASDALELDTSDMTFDDRNPRCFRF